MRLSAASGDRQLPSRLGGGLAGATARLRAIILRTDERGLAGRMSVTAFLIRIVNAVIAFASQVLLARWMGDFDYGVFVFVWSLMILLGNLSCLGFHTSVIRFIPQFRGEGRFAELRGLLAASRAFVLTAATALAALGAALVWLFAERIAPYYTVPLLLGAIALPMMALSDLLQGVARAHSWTLAALIPSYISRPVLLLLVMATALALGAEPSATTAVLAALLATALTTLGQAADVARRLSRSLEAGGRDIRFRFWLSVSLPIFLIEGFFYLVTTADVMMVGVYLRPDDVAVYFATVKTLALVHFVYFAIKAGVAQRYAQFSHADPRQLAAFARMTVAWTFWPSVALAAVVLAVGRPMLELFGPGFAAGYPLIFPLLAGVVARAAVGLAESLLTMSGNHNLCAALYAATLALNVGLSMLLIPHLGLWGAAIATAASMGFEALSLSLAVWLRLGIVMAVFVPARIGKVEA